MMDKHYSVQEIADQWSMSYEAVRERFQHEAGVLRFGTGKRVTLRIPASVRDRVYLEMVVR